MKSGDESVSHASSLGVLLEQLLLFEHLNNLGELSIMKVRNLLFFFVSSCQIT